MPERQSLDADIVCVGFGPATAGFLTTLSRQLLNPDGTPAVESAVMPGMPPQVLCYERADDIGFGVSGVVTRARGLRASFPDLGSRSRSRWRPRCGRKRCLPARPDRREPAVWPLARGGCLHPGLLKPLLPLQHDALELPWTPVFLHKEGGLVLSMGQFMQWVGAQVQSTGTVQIWPGTPVAEALIRGQHRSRASACSTRAWISRASPGDGFMPGMDIRAALTVIGDGPVGPVGQQLDAHFGLPEGHHKRDWAVGMKFVVDLPEDTSLKPGTVLHTFGFPEPEIFGFFYVHPGSVASLGIFVPSWFDSPVRTAYRYLQHWMLHPYLWRLPRRAASCAPGARKPWANPAAGANRTWSATATRASAKASGTTNVLTGSGVDEAWTTGAQLAESVLELLKAGKPFTRREPRGRPTSNAAAPVGSKQEARVAEKSRDGFQKGRRARAARAWRWPG